MTKDEIILAQQARIEQLREAVEYCCSQVQEFITVPGISKALSTPDDLSALRAHDAELDTLQADNARLREALKHYAQEDIRNARHYPPEFAKEALASTHEQPLAEYRNKVLEECAKRIEAYAYMSQNFNALAEELRAMKEQP